MPASAQVASSAVNLPDEEVTVRLGRLLAPLASSLAQQVGICQIWLQGELGAGKTTLARAMLRELGVNGPVKSPTYSLLESYVISGLYLYHFDFYRTGAPGEFLESGFEEYFQAPDLSHKELPSLLLVEWPERAMPYLPPPEFKLCLEYKSTGRLARMHATSKRGVQCLTNVLDDLQSQP